MRALRRDLPWAQSSEVGRERFNVIKGWKGVGWNDMTQGGKEKFAIEHLGELNSQMKYNSSTDKICVDICLYACVKGREPGYELIQSDKKNECKRG